MTTNTTSSINSSINSSAADAPALQSEKEANRIAFVQAGWHSDIVNCCRDSFIKEFATLSSLSVDVIEVPGAYEIPLRAKMLAKSGAYKAIIGAAFVVDGGIYRHEFVAQSVLNGMMQVQLDVEVPVLSVVLTPHHFHANQEHNDFFKDHFVVKGVEAARSCASVIEITPLCVQS